MSVQSVQREGQLAAGGQALLPTYAGTLFLSAWMLFLVQPMVAKMVLPRLGGSPSVWNTAMCFFQAMLLLGYLYAHLLTRLGRRTQGAIHGLVLLGSACFLPLDLSQATPPPEGIPVIWLIGQLAVTVGPPFFALSATAPLLQHWFSRTSHRAAADPYFLYAAGNAGSLLALVAYPLLVEPSLPLAAQSQGWAVGLIFVAGGIALCWLGYRDGAAAPDLAVRVARGPTGASGCAGSGSPSCHRRYCLRSPRTSPPISLRRRCSGSSRSRSISSPSSSPSPAGRRSRMP